MVAFFAAAVFAQTQKKAASSTAKKTSSSEAKGKTTSTASNASKTKKPPATNAKNTKPKTTDKPKSPAPTEKEEFDKALAETDLALKIKALVAFIKKYPKSKLRLTAQNELVVARAQLGDERLRLGEREAGIALFKQAVDEMPVPVPDNLFTKVVVQFPTNLFYRGENKEAGEIAKTIEEKIGRNPGQLLQLTAFYLGTEDGATAKKMADKVLEIDPNNASAYQTMGLAHRINFELEECAAAYAKALELAPASVVSKRSLAEMKRATGKPAEAVQLYRELAEKDPADTSAQTGLILSMFDAGQVADAEEAMTKSLEANPNNLFLLVGAAYWYAAQKDGTHAVEMARKAVSIEPRYTWAHIAMARGLLLQKKPLEAEKVLLYARQFGNFPTLDYEIASVRLSAGFFEEAANELKRSFRVKDELVETNLGGRINKKEKGFIELLELERRASIFQAVSADNPETAEKLKNLLDLAQKLETADAKEDDLNKSIDDFVGGNDAMKAHRQLYAASRLLKQRKAEPKAYDLVQNAIDNLDAGLDVPSPTAAVLADELFEGRTISISQGQLIDFPDLPRQTLLAIMRGRVEELTGWALYNQGKTLDSVIHFKRAVTVLPEKSAWWRSSLWRLGIALEAGGNQKDALDSYVKSYMATTPDPVRRAVIEALYQQINGNLNGIEKLIGAKEVQGQEVAQGNSTPTPERTPETVPVTSPEPSPSPSVEPSVAALPSPSVSAEVTPSATPEGTPSVTPEPTPEPSPSVTVAPTAETTPSPTPTAEPTSTSVESITPTPAASVQTTPTAEPSPEPTPAPTPVIETNPTPIEPKPLFSPVIITVPTASPSDTPKPVDNAAVAAGLERPRTVSETPTATPDESGVAPCLVASQDSITILANGGSLGILIGYATEGDLAAIKATPSSESDITVGLDPEIGKQSGRSFFIIKSVTDKVGLYSVVFEAPCGKKEIPVKVR